ncbi:DUF6878 family protein [Stagnihabitans tardus]|uniref:DUF6878 family protein n=1 Tax=Stagnihabitans tardus TaxID=2699202 RepID=UPI001D10CA3C|nr:DUF6878 family protein [Stagnihabitans tardus]
MVPNQATLRAPLAPRFRLASLLGVRVNQQARIEAMRPVNQARLFEALAEAGISHLTVVFTGLCPAARIDSIAPWAGPHPVELPETRLRYAALTWDAPEVEWRDLSLVEVVEQIVLDLLGDPTLRKILPGGAEGKFCFDAKARTVQLDINETSAEADVAGRGGL